MVPPNSLVQLAIWLYSWVKELPLPCLGPYYSPIGRFNTVVNYWMLDIRWLGAILALLLLELLLHLLHIAGT